MRHRNGERRLRHGQALLLVGVLCVLTLETRDPDESRARAGASAVLVNDGFATARELEGVRGVLLGTNVGAGKEPGEPNHAGDPGGASVWFRWTAPANGEVTFTTSLSALDSVLAIYRGDRLGALTPVAHSGGDPAAPEWATVTFGAMAATPYSIAVDGTHGATGSFRLAWGPSAASEEFGDAEHLEAAAEEPFAGEHTRAARAAAPFLTRLSVGNGGRPYAGDWRTTWP